MTYYDKTSMTKKFQVEVTISYKDMEGQSSLFLTKVFLVLDNKSGTILLKLNMATLVF